VNSNLRSRLFGAKWLMPAGFGSPFENRIGIKATERDRRRTGWGGAKGPSTGQQVEDLLALVLGPVRYAVRYAFFISANKVDDDETTRVSMIARTLLSPRFPGNSAAFLRVVRSLRARFREQ
jgi:hypothetical protein